MKRKFKFIVCLACLSILCFATACDKLTKEEQMLEDGYVISVTYDPNGGKFWDREGIKIKDYFNPDDYAVEGSETVEIPLLDPIDPNRKTSGSAITISRANYFLVGWYEQRTLKTDNDGNVIDDFGNVLTETEKGGYVNEKGEASIPAYEYDGRWDFKTRKLEYVAEDYAENSGAMALTLYAAWVPYYEFEYYREVKGEWQKYGTTSFNYITASSKSDSLIDNLWVPNWKDGAMNYSYEHDGVRFEFPKVDGMTFQKAYLDENRVSEITDFVKHVGSLDWEHAKAINPVQKIYVDFVEGTRYRIENATQLTKNGNSAGIYEILADLDFSQEGAMWPTDFSDKIFTGQFVSATGSTVTIKNAYVVCENAEAQYGGLFGFIDDKAKIKDIVFENVTVDLTDDATSKVRNREYAIFAGDIGDNASVENITLKGDLVFKFGAVVLEDGWKINMMANGKRTGISFVKANLQFVVYASETASNYTYTVTFEDGETGAEKPIVNFSSNDYAVTFNNQRHRKNKTKYESIYTINWEV